MNRDFSLELYYFLLMKEMHELGLISDEKYKNGIIAAWKMECTIMGLSPDLPTEDNSDKE